MKKLIALLLSVLVVMTCIGVQAEEIAEVIEDAETIEEIEATEEASDTDVMYVYDDEDEDDDDEEEEDIFWDLPDKIMMGVGETYQIDAEAAVDFQSTKTKVVTVTEDGEVKGKQSGYGYIKVSDDEGNFKLMKVVVKLAPKTVLVNRLEKQMWVGETYDMTARVPDGYSHEITFTSTDDEIAEVEFTKVRDSRFHATITAVSPGTVKIIAETYNGKRGKMKVVVYEKPEEIELSRSEVTLEKGRSMKLKAEVLPYGAYDSVKWRSSNTSIAKVDSKGKVTARKGGTCVIKAISTYDSTIVGRCELTVYAPPKYVKLSKTSLKLNVGEEKKLVAKVYPSDAEQSVEWSTSDETVVSVENGRLVAEGKGTATITAKTENGKKGKCRVTVK